jgi:type I restriction enzyme S subunit
LGQVVGRPRAKAAPSAHPELPFVGMDSIAPGGMDLLSVGRFGDMKSAGGVFEPGDVLYGRMRPYLNKVHLTKQRGACSAEFIVVPPGPSIRGDFLAYLIHQRAFVNFASEQSSGDRPRVDFEGLASFGFGLPPRAEQQRIVSRIEELFSEIDEGERALERVGQLVERYRQSVLKAAVTGELTSEWRSSPASPSDVTPTIDGASLPPGWSWRSMDDLSWATSYGTSAKCLTEPVGIPVLRIPNVRGGRIELNDLKWAPADLDIDAADLLAPGDLLVVRTNGSESLIGVGAVVLEPQPQPSYFASYLIRFRLKPEPLLAEWVNLLWQSDVVRRFVHEHKATSAGQYNISQSKLRALRLPVPPELERRQVLDAWRTVSTRIAATLREISTGRTAATALRQSILKAAFSGQLVPQDPNDEPASALLARLAAQAADAPASPRRRGRRPAQPTPA